MTAAEVAAAYRVPADMLAAAGWRDADDAEVRDALGYHGQRGCDLGGILMPIRQPRSGEVLGHVCRVRHPPTGAPRYLQPPGCRWLYMPPVPSEWLDDPTVPAVIAEGPKSALALLALAQRHGRRLVAIATCGAWSWRRAVDRERKADGTLAAVTGPSPSLDWLAWQSRDVVVALDGDARSNPAVAAAQRALAHDLAGRGAAVRVAAIPPEAGQKAGPDDVLATCGDEATLALLDAAKPWAESALAAAEAAVSAVEALEKDKRKTAPMPATEIADVADPATRARLVGRLADLRTPGVTRASLEAECARHFAEAEAQRAAAADAARRGKLLGLEIDPAALVLDLEAFFSARAWLPDGAALVLALWALFTHAIDPFATAPYVCLESALPDCGKSTVLDLLEAVCARAEQCSGLTRAVLVRTIEANHATVLLDQGEWLRDKKDETGIMGVLLSGYRRGKPYRCVEGEGHELASFDTFGPKAFCAVGGLRGALVGRCILLHMERLPVGIELESAEPEDLLPIAAPLKERCEAFGLQAANALRQLVAARPRGGYWPQFTSRERQLWTPLLTTARLCGREIERRAVAAAELLAGRKAEAAAEDPRAAKAVALAEVLDAHIAAKFSPGDLVAALAETEAWGEALAEKLRRDDTGKAAANLVGHFLKTFRLRHRERQRAGTLYLTAEALAKVRQHMPPNYPAGTATSATSATDPRQSRGFEVADREKTETRSATEAPRSATAQGRPVLANGSGVADASRPVADAKQDFGRSATPGTRINTGVVADVADVADKTGMGPLFERVPL